MDIYSEAKALSRPFIFDDDTRDANLGIGDHGIIGDGLTAALVRCDGEIDWLCMPRFDSPSVFGSILDEKNGGSMSLRPSSWAFESLQRYDPGTNILETLFTLPGRGVVRMTDYMPWTNDPRASIHEVHRRLEGLEGEVDMTAIFDPRFGYGQDVPEMHIGEHGVTAAGPRGEEFSAVLGGRNGSTKWERRAEGGARAKLNLRAGDREWLVLSWEGGEPQPVRAYRPFEHLRAARHHWREWANLCQYDGPWRHHVLRSALCLKLLIYAPTGAMVAAPTTSLPEWIGGTRNWDYRYAWARDAALAIRAANLLGYSDEARDFFHFVRDTVSPTNALQIMYSIDGLAVPEERSLSHLAGFAGSGPVRVGNGARDQVQHDTGGALVDTAHLYEHFGGSLNLKAWRSIEGVIEHTRGIWREPDHGIWEPRSGMRHNVHSKLMCWLAMDRGAGIAGVFGNAARREQWHNCAQDIHDDMISRGLDRAGSHFVSAYGEEHPDAALLLLPIHGFLPPEHYLMHGTVDWVRKELSVGKLLHRYKIDDGVGGDEGAFVLCGFWLAEALALQGKLDDAREVFVAHADASNHLGLLAEEIDPANGRQLGNFPQAFSHLGLINAALRIDLGLRLRDEGSGRGPHLIGGGERRRPAPLSRRTGRV